MFLRALFLSLLIALPAWAQTPLRQLEDLKAVYDNEGGFQGFTRDLRDTTGAPFVRVGMGWQGQDIRSHFRFIPQSPAPCTQAGGTAECVANGFPDPDDCAGLGASPTGGNANPYYWWQHVHFFGSGGEVPSLPLAVLQHDAMSEDDPTDDWSTSGPFVTDQQNGLSANPDHYRFTMTGYGNKSCHVSGASVLGVQLLDPSGSPTTSCTVRFRGGSESNYNEPAPPFTTPQLRVLWVLADGSTLAWTQPPDDDVWLGDQRLGSRDFWLTRPQCDIAGFSLDTRLNVQDGQHLGIWDVETYALLADADGDGVPDVADNCQLVPNFIQCNTDAWDGASFSDVFGNHCDGDFDQGGTVNSGDATNFFFPDFETGIDSGTGTDMDCGGTVNSGDWSNYWIPQFIQGVPGP